MLQSTMIRVENIRTSKRDLLFTVLNDKGDPSIDNVCPECPLVRLGCSRQVDIMNGRITARVNLDSPRVQTLKANNEEVNCGNTDINFKA